MENEIIYQIFRVNNSLSGIQDSINSYKNSIELFSTKIEGVTNALNSINITIFDYQSKITNQPWFSFIIGSLVTFAAAWFFERIRNAKAQADYLYYLQRMIIDQINSVIDIRRTTEKFLDSKIDELIKNIKANPIGVYSVNAAYYPLFSVRSLPDDLNHKSSGSNYIDNKFAKVFLLSKDFPHIIDDIRLQLKDTIDRNEKIAFGKLNSSEVQKAQYVENLEEYKRAVVEEHLSKNIPLYIKKLVETLVAVQKKSKMSSVGWNIKFNPFYKFYSTKKKYLIDRQVNFERMEKYFEPFVIECFEKMEKDYQESLKKNI